MDKLNPQELSALKLLSDFRTLEGFLQIYSTPEQIMESGYNWKPADIQQLGKPLITFIQSCLNRVGDGIEQDEYMRKLQKFKNEALVNGHCDQHFMDPQIFMEPEITVNQAIRTSKATEIKQAQARKEQARPKELQMVSCLAKVLYLENQLDFERVSKELEKFILAKADRETPYYFAYERQEFEPVEELQRSDVVGVYKFDPFQSVLKVVFVRADKQPFPKGFRISEVKIQPPQKCSLQKWQQLRKGVQPVDEKQLKLQDFISDCLKKHQANPSCVGQVVKLLNKQNVGKISDLFTWTENDWQRSTVMINVYKILIEEVAVFRASGSAKGKEKAKVMPKSEVYAATHRILRYLIYQNDAEKLGALPFLDPRAVEAGFAEISEKFKNAGLLRDLQTFYDSFLIIPNLIPQSLQKYPRGMLLYGPPGTGKTVLTEQIPNRIGLNVICFGLSASDFSKPYVGQTEQMIKQLVERAKLTPYMWCCVAIDEIDGLVPKRDEKQGNSKIDGLAMLLSVIGGIKDVPNLLFVASTNRLNKIDEAFRRRMSGQYQVGRPSPSARADLMRMGMVEARLTEEMLQHCVNITTNFTGAALVNLRWNLIVQVEKGGDKNKVLTYDQLASIAARTANQFSIMLGNYTLPDVFRKSMQKQYLLSLNLLSSIHNRLLLLTVNRQNVRAQFAFKFDKMVMVQNRIESRPAFDLNSYDFVVSENHEDPVAEIEQYILSRNVKKEFDVVCLNPAQEQYNEAKYLQAVERRVRATVKYTRPTIMVIGAVTKVREVLSIGYLENLLRILVSNDRNLFVFLIIGFKPGRDDNPNAINYASTKLQNLNSLVKRTMKWTNTEQRFTGRIFIDLASQYEYGMSFELEAAQQSRVFCKRFLDAERSRSTADVLPALVDFATKRDLDLVLLLDLNLLLTSNAFDESKVKQALQQKIQQARNCDRYLIIIDVGSLVNAIKNISESSMGPSESYSLSDPKVYSLILNYIKTYPKILKDKSQWVAFISDNKALSRYLKDDLQWPPSVDEIREIQKKKEQQKQRKCVRCNKYYFQNDNKKQRKCRKHLGALVDLNANPPEPFKQQLGKIEYDSQLLKYHREKANNLGKDKRNEPIEPRFMYLCCRNAVGTEGCMEFYHTVERQVISQEMREQANEDMRVQIELGLV